MSNVTGGGNSTATETGQGGSRQTKRTVNEPSARANPPIQKFVGEQNIFRFVDQFQIAHDPDFRKKLQTLLLEELNRFGFNSEQPERIQRWIKECKTRIGEHERLIEKGRANGHNTATAERVLNNLIELQEVFWNYHQVVLDALNRSKL